MARNSKTDVLDRVRRERGHRRRWHEILNELDPKTLESIHEQVTDVVQKRQALSRKVKELILVSVDAVTHWPGIVVHLNSALEIGATKEEIVEALETAALPTGHHTLAFGITALDKVLQAREKGTVPELLYKDRVFE